MDGFGCCVVLGVCVALTCCKYLLDLDESAGVFVESSFFLSFIFSGSSLVCKRKEFSCSLKLSTELMVFSSQIRYYFV